MARGLTKDRRGDFWRAWLVRLTAFVFVLQSIGLFVTAARSAPAAAPMAAQVGVSEMGMPDCPHRNSQGKGHDHGSSDSCPMCQTLGFTLAGAPLPSLVARANERLIGLLAVPAPRLPPRAPVLQSPPPRGPPAV